MNTSTVTDINFTKLLKNSSNPLEFFNKSGPYDLSINDTLPLYVAHDRYNQSEYKTNELLEQQEKFLHSRWIQDFMHIAGNRVSNRVIQILLKAKNMLETSREDLQMNYTTIANVSTSQLNAFNFIQVRLSHTFNKMYYPLY